MSGLELNSRLNLHALFFCKQINRYFLLIMFQDLELQFGNVKTN